MMELFSSGFVWLRGHEIGLTILVLVVCVPLYMREHHKRGRECAPQVWLMFSANMIGIMAGLYVLVPTLVASLGQNPTNNQETLMAAFGSLAVVLFTGQNLFKDLSVLLSEEIQPKTAEGAAQKQGS